MHIRRGYILIKTIERQLFRTESRHNWIRAKPILPTIGIYTRTCQQQKRSMSSSTSDETFLYFGFGSNLSTERIHIQNPSAVKKDIGKLQDYKLAFNYRSTRWHGAAATIEHSPGDHVWGVVWELNKVHLATLDDQEGVHYGVYKPLEVTVTSPSGESLTCRTYQLLIHDSDDRRPSRIYKNVILKGATENGLPADYMAKLHAIEDNGYEGEVDLLNKDAPQIRK